MIDNLMARVREPRFGVALASGVIAFLMSSHWTPMAIPGAVAIGLTLIRPAVAVRPAMWWVMAGLWFAAVILVQDRMEDHVYLFAVWLVALAVSLTGESATFLDRAAWHARVLIGVTFAAAVSWKLFFGQYVSGMTLWMFLLFDNRFEPLSTMMWLPDAAMEQSQVGLRELMTGAGGTSSIEAPSDVLWRVSAVALLTLFMEAVIAISHLLPDSSRLAVLRLPSVVLFGVVTYAVVPVLPFAALLALLAMVVARWRPDVMWVFPALVLVSVIRLLFLVI